MEVEELQEAVCLAAYCTDDREGLKTAINCLIDEAYTREIVPSLIDFYLTTSNEWALTLYGYPIKHGWNHTINRVIHKTSQRTA